MFSEFKTDRDIYPQRKISESQTAVNCKVTEERSQTAKGQREKQDFLLFFESEYNTYMPICMLLAAVIILPVLAGHV